MLLRVPLWGWGSLASPPRPTWPTGATTSWVRGPLSCLLWEPCCWDLTGAEGVGLQVGHDSGCGALAKCLVELREYGSRPGFSVTSSSTCNAVSPWLTQGKGLLVMDAQSALV